MGMLIFSNEPGLVVPRVRRWGRRRASCPSPIDGGPAHAQQQRSGLWVKHQLLLSLQDRHDFWQVGFESFATGAIQYLPNLNQGGDYCHVVGPSPAASLPLSSRSPMVQELDGIFAMITGNGDKLIEDALLFLTIGFPVTRSNRFQHFASCLRTHTESLSPFW